VLNPNVAANMPAKIAPLIKRWFDSRSLIVFLVLCCSGAAFNCISCKYHARPSDQLIASRRVPHMSKNGANGSTQLALLPVLAKMPLSIGNPDAGRRISQLAAGCEFRDQPTPAVFMPNLIRIFKPRTGSSNPRHEPSAEAHNSKSGEWTCW
jgi:hypothetical protein